MGFSVHSPRYVKRAWIRAEEANRALPHLVRWCVEEQIAIDVAQQPRGLLELGFELTGTPSGVTHNQTRIGGRRRLEQPAQQRGRRGQRYAVRDLDAAERLRMYLAVAEQHAASSRFDRPS